MDQPDSMPVCTLVGITGYEREYRRREKESRCRLSAVWGRIFDRWPINLRSGLRDSKYVGNYASQKELLLWTMPSLRTLEFDPDRRDGLNETIRLPFPTSSSP